MVLVNFFEFTAVWLAISKDIFLFKSCLLCLHRGFRVVEPNPLY